MNSKKAKKNRLVWPILVILIINLLPANTYGYEDPGVSDPKTTYTYDANGNLTSQTDAESQTINYTYDQLDRILTENTTETTYTYDTATNGIGRLDTVTSAGGSKSYDYDLRGYITDESKVINSTTYDTGFDYNLLGNITKITYPDTSATEIDYGYNNAGQIEEITDYVDDFDYSPIDTVSYIDFANGITTTNAYDATKLYRLTDKVTTDGVDNLQDISYTFDAVGNITAIDDDSDTDAGKDAAYVYDDLHRLTNATTTNAADSNNYTRTYTYSVTGNISTKSDVGTYTYANIHPHAVTSDGTNTYTYDNNGSLTGDGTWTHTYDTRNRLTQSADGSSTITYTYDEGRTRMTKSDGTTTTTYVNDYFEKEGDLERDFILANGLKVATLEDDSSLMAFGGPVLSSVAALEEGVTEERSSDSEPEAEEVTEEPAVDDSATTEVEELETEAVSETIETEAVEPAAESKAVEPAAEEAFPVSESLTTTLTSYPRIIFHHEDHLSGASVDTDENGDIVLISDYYPYGAQRIEDKAVGYENDYLFTGQERDEETDLYYYGARYYDPELGRFTSVDPLVLDQSKETSKVRKDILSNPQLLNAYSYTSNNPLKYTDPTGELVFMVTVDPTQLPDSNPTQNIDYGQAYTPTELTDAEKYAVAAIGTLATGGTISTGAAYGYVDDIAAILGFAKNTADEADDALIVNDSSNYESRWGDPSKIDDHFQRHGKIEFGYNTPEEYTQSADDLFNNPNTQRKIDTTGVTRVYDSNTNSFGSYNSNGTIRTHMKPTGGQKYFDSQPGVSQ